MKWLNLLLILCIVGTFAQDELDIPDDIDDDELDEDEEILRLLEDKKILEDLKRENEKAREVAYKYHEEHGRVEGTETRMICEKFNYRLFKDKKLIY